MTSFIKSVLLIVLSFIISNCINPLDHINKKQTPKKINKEKVLLPPSPTLKTVNFPIMYADGSYTVQGFLSKINEFVDKDVTVKGYVYQKYVCTAEEKVCKAASHLNIVDDIYSPKAKLLVVGPEIRIINEFEEKKGYSFTGKASYFSPDSKFIKVEGLLVLPEKPVDMIPEAKK